jgi:hypothetical protein
VSGTGVVSWTNPANIVSSDDTYATVTNGTSQLLRASQFSFSLPTNATILGIEMSVEKRGRAQNNVGAGTWAFRQAPAFVTGQPASTYNTTSYTYTAATGTNRILLVGIVVENVDNIGSNPAITITSVQYGGQSLTAVATQSTASTSTRNVVAFYYLPENQLALAAGNTLVVQKTRSGTAAGNDNEYVEYLAINTFTFVNQQFPIDFASSSATGTTIGAGPVQVRRGDYLVSITNSNTPGITYTQSAGNTLVANTNINNVLTSGITFQLQTRPGVTANTALTPTATSTVSTQRLNMISIVVRGGRVFDNLTQLQQNGTPLGNNLALGSAVIENAWPDDDAISSYGGPANVWGRTWSVDEINNAGFGLDIQAEAGFSIASVDAVQARVTFTLPLPVSGHTVSALCTQSAFSARLEAISPSTELWLERSMDGNQFAPIRYLMVQEQTQHVSFTDATPGQWYYRLSEKSELHSGQIGTISFCSVSPVATKCYPNPVKDLLYVEAADTILSVSLLNNLGNVVFEERRLECNFHVLSLQERALPAGSYVLRMQTARGTSIHPVVLE